MKDKGVIRRMDDIGRITIPREFRKVARIKEGDPMSISVTENGDLLVSRVDYMGDLLNFGAKACEILSAETGNAVLLYSKGAIRAGSGMGAKALVERSGVGKSLAETVDEGKFYMSDNGEMGDYKHLIAVPIKGSGNLYGAFVMLSESLCSPSEQKIISVSARIIGSLIQNY